MERRCDHEYGTHVFVAPQGKLAQGAPCLCGCMRAPWPVGSAMASRVEWVAQADMVPQLQTCALMPDSAFD